MLSGGGSSILGLQGMIENKLSLSTVLFNPFQTLAGYENLELSNPNQYAVATGLAIRGGLDK